MTPSLSYAHVRAKLHVAKFLYRRDQIGGTIWRALQEQRRQVWRGHPGKTEKPCRPARAAVLMKCRIAKWKKQRAGS